VLGHASRDRVSVAGGLGLKDLLPPWMSMWAGNDSDAGSLIAAAMQNKQCSTALPQVIFLI